MINSWIKIVVDSKQITILLSRRAEQSGAVQWREECVRSKGNSCAHVCCNLHKKKTLLLKAKTKNSKTIGVRVRIKFSSSLQLITSVRIGNVKQNGTTFEHFNASVVGQERCLSEWMGRWSWRLLCEWNRLLLQVPVHKRRSGLLRAVESKTGIH